MKVCVVGPPTNWRGGMLHYATQFINSMSARNEIVFISYKKMFPSFLYRGKTKKVRSKEKIKDGIKEHKILKYYSMLSALQANRLIKKSNCDVIHVHWITPYLGFLFFWFFLFNKIISKKSTVLTVHNVLPHEQRLIGKIVGFIIFRMVDMIIVHSESNKKEMVKIFKVKNVKVIPHGDYSFFNKREISETNAKKILGLIDKKVILQFGIVRKYKGLDYSIKAMKKIVKNEKNAILVVAGEFWKNKKIYSDLIKKLDLEKHIKITDRYIDDEEVEIFFKAADVVVCPYVNFSGQSGTAQIAFAFGKPVVTTNVGGLRSIIKHGENGYLVKQKDDAELAKYSLMLLKDKKLREKIGKKGKEISEKEYSWEIIVEKANTIYENLIGD